MLLTLGTRFAARTDRPGAGAHEVRRMFMPDFVGVLLEDLVFVEPLGGVLPGRASRLAVGRLEACEALVADRVR